MQPYQEFIEQLNKKYSQGLSGINPVYPDEVYLSVREESFADICLYLHKTLNSAVMMFFADMESIPPAGFRLYCVFLSAEFKKWFLVKTDIPIDTPKFNSLSKEIYSAHFFEREIKEMFGIEPVGSPDLRSFNLHDEVWPKGQFPLRKDFNYPAVVQPQAGAYSFIKVQGEGIFEVPVGPVHAGIIGPGHFRFSVSGEPIINLETRLGFTHRGVEKLFEGKKVYEAVDFCECICGDTAFAYSMAFCRAVEKICGINVSKQARISRAIFLELERMYNHIADIGAIALDVGFSFPAMYAQVIKERILRMNETLTFNRYLKGINSPGEVRKHIDRPDKLLLSDSLKAVKKDFNELKKMLLGSVSFMDRVDGTGVLRKKTAQDLGIVGLPARASGIGLDLRKVFSCVYEEAGFLMRKEESGDCLARLNLRLNEFTDSAGLIEKFMLMLEDGPVERISDGQYRQGFALGCVEAWRGPLLFWLKLNKSGVIERCKIVDPSFHNWQGLSFAVLGNIMPDFPLCNKSFNLSYSGNDL